MPYPHLLQSSLSLSSFPANFPKLHSLRLPSPPSQLFHLPRPRRLRSFLRLTSASGDVDAFTENSGYLFQLSVLEADSLAAYDISRITDIFKRRPFIVARRLFQIGTTFGKWFALRYVDSLMERSDQMFEVRAAELRKILVELGPAYIKIAQAVSSRADLIPPSYLDELSLLQDQISPFSTEDAITIIEQELGLQIDDIFSEISPEPVAAASLGQVYQARLRQKGQLVAVKVQRPGVQAAISLDILILRYLAGLIKRAGKLNTDLQAVVDEWASSLFREMDYRLEAQNGVKFRQLYGNLPDVVVPEMYVGQTSRRVLIMEWVEGQKLSGVKDLYLIEVGVYCSFNQLLEYGFYHADPHPGNLLRTNDGKLAYIDFGMMGEFREELRDGFIEACLHLVNRDFEALAKDFVTLGLIPPTADRVAVTKALTGVFQNAVAKGVSNISFSDLSGNLGVTMYKFKFRIPSYFSLVIRSLAVLEGIAISSNPDYKVLGSTYPWIARKVLTDSSPKLQSSLRSLLYKEGVFRIDRLESLLSESLRARAGKALVQNQEGGESRVVIKQVLSFMLTEKGSFVRDILLQELAKGLDALGLALSSAATARLPFGITFSISRMTDEDKINLTTLYRLLLLMASVQETGNSGKVVGVGVGQQKNQEINLEDVSSVLNQLASIDEVLPILSIIPELPPESQQQLLNLPVDLSGRLISRVAARTIRRVFV
uniref:Protein kinase domain-containing protein n=1 Tax=Cannabis sativa TaxID=3483 RepID=A0A803NGY1_CANSA